jgi:electron transfer flavoprotein alpha subunit
MMRDFNMSEGIFIVGEICEGKIASITAELLGIGRKLSQELGHELSSVFLGTGITEAAKEAIALGADKLYIIDNPLFKNYVTDSYVAALESLCKQTMPEILLLGQTSMGRDLAPSLAFRLQAGVTLDCVELSIDSKTKLLKKTKPVYGGNALAIYVSEAGRPQMATIRPKTMPPSDQNTSRKGTIIHFDPKIDESTIRTRFISREDTKIEGVKLVDADVIVCGGRGLDGPEPYNQLEELAGILNGAVGASRPPCDNGWVPSHYQIGLTGDLVSPDLYIGIAVSGSSQHLAGILGSKTIVAINKNPKANIFSVAQYGVVGDYKDVLPSFIEKCKELLSG